MDSFEWNKIAGAVLFAMLVFMGLWELNTIVLNPEPKDVVGYEVPGVELQTTTAAAPPPEVPFAVLLAQGSAEAGKRVYNKCKSCHTIEEGGRNGTGPNLWDTVGNVKGHIAGFNYSSALLEKGGRWTYENLDEWLKRPAAYIPGNRMAYGGLRDAQERADVILYMREFTPNPPPLPPVPETEAAPEAEEAPAADAVTGAVETAGEAADAVQDAAADAVDAAADATPVEPMQTAPVEGNMEAAPEEAAEEGTSGDDASGEDVPVETPSAETPAEQPAEG